jgi:DNA polymerase delta subunit 3
VPAAKPSPSIESTVPAKRPLQKEAPPANAEASKPDDSKSQSSSTTNSQATSKTSGKPAPPKREKSNLFSSFAKAKPKAKAPTPAEPAAQDVVLDDASEEEEEAEELFPDSTDKATIATRESRKEREERLKKMMDDDEADGTSKASLEKRFQLNFLPQTKKCPMPKRSQNESPLLSSNRHHPSPLSSKNM